MLRRHHSGTVTGGKWLLTLLALVMTLGLSLGSVGIRSAGAQDEDEEPSGTPTAEEAPSSETSAESEVAEALPPADLPTGNLIGVTYEIEASLDADLDAAPREAIVYRLTLPETSEEATAELAERLGIEGDVEDRGNGTYVVSGNGDLFVTPQLVQYLSPETPTLADLPADDEAIELARDWLRSTGLAPADLGEGTVAGRAEEVGRVTVAFSPLEPTPILAAYPSITVVLGPDGVVLEASLRWAEIAVADRYLLRPAEDAWRQVEAGQAYIEVDYGGNEPKGGTTVAGEAMYTEISIAYTTGGLPTETQYLLPVYVFAGELTVEDGGTFPIRAYVPAIATSDTPVG